MSVYNFKDLQQHIGHELDVVTYNNPETAKSVNVAIECRTCNEVLLDFDRENARDTNLENKARIILEGWDITTHIDIILREMSNRELAKFVEENGD